MSELAREIIAKEMEILEKKMELVAERAYLKGVEDARAKMEYPQVLRKEHLCEIMQCSMAMVNKIIVRSDFPKFEPIQARYPRDQVFDWINRNSSTYGSELLQFGSKRAI